MSLATPLHPICLPCAFRRAKLFLLHDEDGVARQRAPLADGVNLLVRARLDIHLHQ